MKKIIHCENQLDHWQQGVGRDRNRLFNTTDKRGLDQLYHSTGPFFFGAIRLFLIAMIVLGILWVSCEAKRPFRIGFIGTLSGRVAYLGLAGRDAVQLAVDQCNARGGIHGRRVELIIQDDQQNEDTVVEAVQALIQAGGEAVIGPMTSNMAMVITPYLNESRIIAVSPTVSTGRLSGKDDYFLRVNPATDETAIHSAEYQLRSEGVRKFLVIYDKGNRAYSESWLNSFKKRFVAGGGQITATVAFGKGEHQSFSEIVHAALVNDFDGILIIANAMDCALICHQIRKSDPDTIITLAGWGATERLIELGGRAVEGVTVVQHFNRDSLDPAYQRFRKHYLERFRQEPGFPGVYAYDAAQIVLTALDNRKKGQRLKVSILSIGEFNGLQGKIIFDAYGDVKRSNTFISVVRNQKFVVVE